jgi:RNA polymerase sigma-70 factor, ECF subfamily
MLHGMASAHRDSADYDFDTVEALRRGDNEAFEELVERHEALMLRVASNYVRTRAVAQEVVQETWLSVFRWIHTFECRSALKTWIFRILVNHAKSRAVAESRSVPFSSLEPAGRDADSLTCRPRVDSPSPEQTLISRETLQHVVHAMERLPQSQREVIALRDLHGWSSEEVCSALGMSGGNQRVRLHRARGKVEHELERYLAPTAPTMRSG